MKIKLKILTVLICALVAAAPCVAYASNAKVRADQEMVKAAKAQLHADKAAKASKKVIAADEARLRAAKKALKADQSAEQATKRKK